MSLVAWFVLTSCAQMLAYDLYMYAYLATYTANLQETGLPSSQVNMSILDSSACMANSPKTVCYARSLLRNDESGEYSYTLITSSCQFVQAFNQLQNR